MVAGRFWDAQGLDIDLAGPAAQINCWPLTSSLDPTAALRRTIANVWFEVRQPNPDFENFLATGGVIWSLFIWPFLEAPPLPGAIIEPGPSVLGNRMIAWGAGPGARIEDTALGVHRFVFPGDRSAFHVDVQSQRKVLDDFGNPWVPYVGWAFDNHVGLFDDVAHCRVVVKSTWLMDRPEYP
jgi:hypothetical protein